MIRHEMKNCPRCGEEFECKTGSISICQCQAVSLTSQQADYIAARFDGCLCAGCLAALRAEYNVSKFSARLAALLAGR